VTVPIKISPEALVAFKNQLRARTTTTFGIRLGVRGGGCTGLYYYVGYEDEMPGSRDVSWQLDDVNFVIDKKSLVYLSGSAVVWKKTMMKTGFEFENPNEASKCGCGHSFSSK
jgi:iron-sulfur cluster assembly protein